MPTYRIVAVHKQDKDTGNDTGSSAVRPGIRVTACDAQAAAATLARRVFGEQSGVESFWYAGRTYRPNGYGGGSVTGKAFRALLTTTPTAEQRYSGTGYERHSVEIVLATGRLRPEDVPPLASTIAGLPRRPAQLLPDCRV